MPRPQSRADRDLVARAHKNFGKCVSWERQTRPLYVDDMKFLFADSDNNEQWNAAVRARRQLEGQPMLTVNKTHTHWLHVVNQAKANKPSISVHPTGSQATYDAAQIFAGIIRHIEYASNAQAAYATAVETQVGGGIGYWRIVTDYADDNGFDQEIFIRPVRDPLSVYMDPPKLPDGSDATWCFVYEDRDRETFEAQYPNFSSSGQQDTDLSVSGWLSDGKVRVAEYYEVETKKEWMYAIPQADGGGFSFMRESELTPEVRSLLAELARNGEEVRRRRVDKRTVRWYLLAGDQIVDRNVWAGKYIPVIRLVGEEVIIDGRMDRKGLVRYLKDAQRMYNYNTSAQVEYGALQSKTPYTGPIEAIEGHENYWATANRENHSFLPYNHADENGNPIPAPVRQQPPQAAEAFSVGMQSAAMEMMMASGQYEATFGRQTQELSGVSQDNRKDQGERATFHFLDHEADAIRFTGKQLIDLVPKIYDTKRIIRIMGEDGQEDQIEIDPSATKSLVQQRDKENNIVKSIFNPNVGTYDVISKCGPNYDTRREEAFQAMTGLLSANPALTQVIGDLYMGTADFPVADKLQERMRNWIPKEIQGVGPSQSEQQLTQQLQQAMQMIQQLQGALQSKEAAEKLAKQHADIDGLNHLALRMENDRQDTINAFKAETDRLKALADQMNPAALAPIIRKMLVEILQTPDMIVGNQPGELSGSDAYATGMTGTTIGQPLSQSPTGAPGLSA